MYIYPDFFGAVKVMFKKPIFEDDFVERGMTAWLVAVEWDQKTECFNLFFNFEEFEDINAKYFRRTYHPNRHTAKNCPDSGRKLFTAIEAGCYDSAYSVYFSVPGVDATTYEDMSKASPLPGHRSKLDLAFARELFSYLHVLSERA